MHAWTCTSIDDDAFIFFPIMWRVERKYNPKFTHTNLVIITRCLWDRKPAFLGYSIFLRKNTDLLQGKYEWIIKGYALKIKIPNATYSYPAKS